MLGLFTCPAALTFMQEAHRSAQGEECVQMARPVRQVLEGEDLGDRFGRFEEKMTLWLHVEKGGIMQVFGLCPLGGILR